MCINQSSFQPKVSVIIAVYNVEKWIRRCLDSLLVQTFKDFEVILVDDGSTDTSGKICDEYASKDKRFRVIHQKNQGVAVARQVGIDNARGEYTIHCDPDDWVEPDMLESLYDEAVRSKADIVFCDYYWDKPNGTIVKHVMPRASNMDTLTGLVDGSIHGSLCLKLIKRELYKKYGVHFVPSMNYMEDCYVCCAFLMHKEVRIAYVPKALYHYVVHDSSLSSALSRKQVDSMILFLKTFENVFNEKEYNIAIRKKKIQCKLFMWGTQKYKEKELINQFKEVNNNIIRQGLSLRGGDKNTLGLVLTLLHLYPIAVMLHRVHLKMAIPSH